MAKVSLIVPVYNVENYLGECIESILKQTLQDIEIIFINDASTDSSASILENIKTKDSRIKVLTHAHNQGLGAARNTGVASASSKYIMFIDSDDYIAKNMVEELYQLIEYNSAQLAWCGIGYISTNGENIGEGAIPSGTWSVLEVLNNSMLYPSILSVCNKIFCFDLFKEIKQLPIISEDQPAIAEYLTFTEKIITSEKVLYFYRQNNNTLSKPKDFKVDLWNHYFYSHALFFNILRNRFSKQQDLRMQAILRYNSVLWRINNFKLLELSNWEEHAKALIIHIKEDKIGLKKYSPLMYYTILFFLKSKINTKIKKKHLKLLTLVAKHKWPKRSSWIYLPADIIFISKPYLKSSFFILINTIEITLYKSLGKILRLTSGKPIWLISERIDTAQDNGYCFFNYLIKKDSNLKVFYIIDTKCQQALKIKNSNKIIDYNSFKHKVFFYACSYYVSSHDKICFPSTYLNQKIYAKGKFTLNIFLQHGITYADVSSVYGKKNCCINLFICGALPEYKYVLNHFGYLPNEVKYTGFARFDNLHEYNTKNIILLMPTWRRNIWENRLVNNHKYFLNSVYFKTFNSLIKNKDLIALLDQYNFELVFYPHYEIQPYINYFDTSNNKIILANKDLYNVQELLKKSKILITDSSSVHFDFAYMKKPVIYYLFDKIDFDKSHLTKGYFDHETMGFGEVTLSEVELIKLLEKYLKTNCLIDEKYKQRIYNFFPIQDKNNNERIYNEIISFK